MKREAYFVKRPKAQVPRAQVNTDFKKTQDPRLKLKDSGGFILHLVKREMYLVKCEVYLVRGMCWILVRIL